MWKRYKNVVPPALLAAVVAVVGILGAAETIPQPAELLAAVGRWLGTATPPFVAACAFLENTVVLNSYFPGAFVILYSMAATHGDMSRAMAVFGAIALGSVLAQHLNYLVGRWLASTSRESRAIVVGGLLSYWHPQLGAIYSLRLGLRGRTYGEFLRALCVWFLWTLFWGVLMYGLGRVPVSGNSFGVIFVAYVGVWLVVEVYKARRTDGFAAKG
ncbi:MAG: hypothetical protein QOC81_1408 [Thermoanaerobaculia bacterium]|jgi:membrane protein DedA with SNARE-associated domain|nr:hypothetical protein [Thermoanaerobaculia bacterium]